MEEAGVLGFVEAQVVVVTRGGRILDVIAGLESPSGTSGGSRCWS